MAFKMKGWSAFNKEKNYLDDKKNPDKNKEKNKKNSNDLKPETKEQKEWYEEQISEYIKKKEDFWGWHDDQTGSTYSK